MDNLPANTKLHEMLNLSEEEMDELGDRATPQEAEGGSLYWAVRNLLNEYDEGDNIEHALDELRAAYGLATQPTESREREALRWEIAKACKEAWDEGNEAGTPLEDPTVRDFLPTADAILGGEE